MAAIKNITDVYDALMGYEDATQLAQKVLVKEDVDDLEAGVILQVAINSYVVQTDGVGVDTLIELAADEQWDKIFEILNDQFN